MDDGQISTHLRNSSAPSDRAWEFIDARDLPPPEPLTASLEHREAIDDSAVLIQLNDRVPQHLYPKLDDRGYAHETFETGEGILTLIWSE